MDFLSDDRSYFIGRIHHNNNVKQYLPAGYRQEWGNSTIKTMRLTNEIKAD